MDVSISFRRQCLALVASLGITPMIALADSDDGTITVGFGSVPPTLCWWGYPGDIGSYSPTGLTGGKTVAGLWTNNSGGPSCSGTYLGHLLISGFSSSPGQSWLMSVTCNGTTKTGATATYSYSSGEAEWSWSETSWGFVPEVGSQLACTIVHS